MHDKRERANGWYKYKQKVVDLFVRDCFEIGFTLLITSDAPSKKKTLHQVLQGICLNVISVSYMRNLFVKYYCGPTVTKNKMTLRWYRGIMVFILHAIDVACRNMVCGVAPNPK